MNTPERSNGLSSLDWFGIITGGIGLVADVISLSALFAASKQPTQSGSVSTWLVISFLAIIYTVSIASFFGRRFFVTRNARRYKHSLARANFLKRAELGTTFLSFLIGLPLIMAYFVSVLSIFPDIHITPVQAFNLPRPVTEGLLHGFIIGSIVCLVINWVTRMIYQAYEPEYRL